MVTKATQYRCDGAATIGVSAFWLQWQHAEPTGLQVQQLSGRWRRGCLGVSSAVSFLGRLQVFLRKAIRADRATYLRKLAKSISLSSFLRRFTGPSLLSRQSAGEASAHFPLFCLKTAPKPKAQDASARLQRWTVHVAQQEGGCIVIALGYDQQVCQQAPSPGNAPLFDFRRAPPLLDIEQDILQLCRGKAAGPDLITAHLLKLGVPNSTRRLLPIFTRAALACREPIIFKGGCPITLAKISTLALTAQISAAYFCPAFQASYCITLFARVYSTLSVKLLCLCKRVPHLVRRLSC